MSSSHEPTPAFRAMQEIRKGNAAQPHKDKRTKKARSRKAALRKELKNGG